jgi:hypothetical protein
LISFKIEQQTQPIPRKAHATFNTIFPAGANPYDNTKEFFSIIFLSYYGYLREKRNEPGCLADAH